MAARSGCGDGMTSPVSTGGLARVPAIAVAGTVLDSRTEGRAPYRGTHPMKITFVRPNLGDQRSHDAMEPLVFALLASLTPRDVERTLYDERIGEVGKRAQRLEAQPVGVRNQ